VSRAGFAVKNAGGQQSRRVFRIPPRGLERFFDGLSIQGGSTSQRFLP